jgi:hypothetical protein
MKLQYRGNVYESHPGAIASVNSQITAKFRGLIYHLQQPVKTYFYSLSILKYRGKNYIKTHQTISPSDTKSCPAEDINDLCKYSIHEDTRRFINDLNKFYF